MPNQERKERALEALKKYRGRVTSEERIASFAAWFVEQECAWKDVRKEPPTDTILVQPRGCEGLGTMAHRGTSSVGF